VRHHEPTLALPPDPWPGRRRTEFIPFLPPDRFAHSTRTNETEKRNESRSTKKSPSVPLASWCANTSKLGRSRPLKMAASHPSWRTNWRAPTYLEKRLHATLEAVSTAPNVVLKTPLRATQLLELIERPVNPDRYRDKIHNLLQTIHSKKGGGFQVAGGFKDYNSENPPVGSLEATSFAVKLMEFYGIPAELDPNWVRSFLRPLFIRRAPQTFMAAVTLDRLNRLPDVKDRTWLETLYYERSLLAAVVLIGLCIYAALSSPMPRAVGTNDGSSPPESFHDAGSI